MQSYDQFEINNTSFIFHGNPLDMFDDILTCS